MYKPYKSQNTEQTTIHIYNLEIMYRKHKPALYTYLQTLLIEPNIFKYHREKNIQVTFFIFQNSPFILFSS